MDFSALVHLRVGITISYYISCIYRNLKTSILRHLEDHCDRTSMDEDDADKIEKAGLAVARVCLYMYKEALPFSKFEGLLHLQELNARGLVGNINHSHNFCAGFLSSTAKTLVEDVSTFLSQPQPATGSQLPMALSDDLGTYQVQFNFVYINFGVQSGINCNLHPTPTDF